jgi:hypothetical protein
MQTEEYLNHYRGCIRIYTGAAQTLERRIADSNVGTSAKNGAISAEPKKPMKKGWKQLTLMKLKVKVKIVKLKLKVKVTVTLKLKVKKCTNFY